jgi:hypothetical protein
VTGWRSTHERHPNRTRGSSALCLLGALVFYGLLAVHWSRTFAAETLPVDAYFGLDSLATYDAATQTGYQNDRLYTLHPLFGAMLHMLTAPLVGCGISAKHALLAWTVLAAALQVMLLHRIVAAFAMPAPARAALVIAFACSYTQLVQSSAQDSFVFSGLAFMVLFHHAFAVLVEGRAPSLPVLFGVGSALMATTVTNVVPFALASAMILVPTTASRRWTRSVLLVLAVVVGTAGAAYAQRHWHPEAAWFPASFARALAGDTDAEPVTHEFHFVNPPASIGGVVEVVRNLLLLPWLFAGFILRADPVSGVKEFFLRPPSGPPWLIWGACCVMTAWAACRASWPAPWRRYASVFAIVFLFHFGLHVIYGRLEAYLYAPHYLGAMTLLVALALRGLGTARRLASLVVALVALVLVVNNLRQLDRFHTAFAAAFGHCALVRNADGSAVCR